MCEVSGEIAAECLEIHTEGVNRVQNLISVEVVESDKSRDLESRFGRIVFDSLFDAHGFQQPSSFEEREW